LDDTFDGDGKVTTPVLSGNREDDAQALAIQDDGKIVVAGYSHNGSNYDFALARYTTTGQLDTTFGMVSGGSRTGKLTTDFSGGNDQAFGVVIQNNGYIVVVGTTQSGGQNDFAIARYEPDGDLDLTFDGVAGASDGEDGRLKTDFFGGNDEAFAVGLQSDGRIIVAGRAHDGADYDFGVARYGTTGMRDTSFGGFVDGKVITKNFYGQTDGDDRATSLAVKNDNSFVVAGYSRLPGSANDDDEDFSVVRHQASGAHDTSFDDDGKLRTDFGGSSIDKAYGVAFQGDFVVVVGRAGTSAAGDFVLARYEADGDLDPNFDGPAAGNNGKFTTDFGSGNAEARSVVVQPGDARIVVAGFSNGDFALARYMPSDGALDPTFDVDGRVTTNISGVDEGHAVALDEDGKIVVAGFATLGATGKDFAVARYVVVNARPVISVSSFQLSPIQEDPASNPGTLVSTLVTQCGGTDADGDVLGIAVTAVDNTNGTWQYSTNGSTWFALPAVSATSAWLLAPAHRVRFDPDPDYSATPGPALTFKLWDQTTGAASTLADTTIGTAFSTSTAQAHQPVTAVNDRPVINTTSFQRTPILEDPASNPGTLVSTLVTQGGGSDPDGNALGVAVTAVDNSNGAWQYSTNGGSSWQALSPISATSARLLAPGHLVRFVPNANYNATPGPALTFKLWDQTSGTAGMLANTTTGTAFSTTTAQASQPVTAVNDAPTFNLQSSHTATGSGPQSAVLFATSIIAGPANESAQTLMFQFTSISNPALFAAGPAINPSGTLTYTPASGANGTAMLQVVLKDNGGTSNGGVDTSITRSFTITINAPPPTLPGDYNQSGVVDAADYVMFRKYQGTTTTLPNDAFGGVIDADQYNQWRQNFGDTSGAGGGAEDTSQVAATGSDHPSGRLAVELKAESVSAQMTSGVTSLANARQRVRKGSVASESVESNVHDHALMAWVLSRREPVGERVAAMGECLRDTLRPGMPEELFEAVVSVFEKLGLGRRL
jgi:uncharacterized delta-60 repeat protein